MNHSVIFRNVTKNYKLYKKSSEKLLDMIIPKKYGEDFYAVKDISFTAEKGDVIGIIGVNGAGKSTLSNMITGVIPPSSGEIQIEGQASLISIAAGLNNELTGRENIELKCLMLGFSKKEIQELMPEIIEFADIGKFIDQPVKSYSSGMKSRLGFAISVTINPDVLVIDEALSVGDQTFINKCIDKMNEFKEKGKTIFFISHSLRQIRRFCQKALWLEAGEVKAYGTLQEVLPQYEMFLKEFRAMSKEAQRNFRQLVLEKRGQLSEQQLLEIQKHEARIPRSKSRVKGHRSFLKKVRTITMSIFVMGAIIAGVGYAAKLGFIPIGQENAASPSIENTIDKETVQPETEIDVEAEEKPDIRYVNVANANIRSNPMANSPVVGSATFGQAYQIEDIQQDSTGAEWLKITYMENSKGWLSSKIISPIETELNDLETTNKIDSLIGFTPSLSEAIPMIGKQQGEEQVFNYTEYLYINGEVNGFTINISDSSETNVINELGEPHLRMDKVFIYHGSTYDFTFTVLNTGMINTLTVTRR